MRWKSLSCLLPLLITACARAAAPVPEPEPVPVVVPEIPLADADIDTIAEIMRLEDRREYDPARFGVWSRAQHEGVRSRAVIGAGRIGDRAASSLLITALADPEADVRRDAAFALGELGDTASAVVTALISAVRQPDSVGVEAIAALGRLANPAGTATRITIDPRAAETIEAILADVRAQAVLRDEALINYWRFLRRLRTLELVTPSMNSSSVETRWRALYTLTRGAPDPRSVPQFIAWLNDADGSVRALAARGLRAVTADSAGQRTQAMFALRTALQDVHPHVRINAVRALGGYRVTENVAVMAALLRDADGNVAIAAAESLGENGSADAELAAAARSHSSIAVRTAATAALLRSPTGRSSAIEIARTRIRDPLWLERYFALRTLGSQFNPAAIEDVRPLIEDPDPRVAASAINALVNADTVNPPRALFIEKLAHPDAGVRAAATRGLQRRATPADQEIFLRAYDRARSDTHRVAAEAAVDALGALARDGVPVARSFFLRFSKPNDPLLHQRVVQRLGAGEWEPVRPIDSGRPRTFYRDLARRILRDSSAAFPRVRVRTAAGEFVIEFNALSAPLTVQNFISLTDRGYFNNGRWHRVVPNFVLQDGDPRGDGSGGPGTVLRDEINRLRYERGAVGMALSGPDTGGSQWFIAHSPQPHLDGGYTVFGRVVTGMEVADKVVQDDPIVSIEVVR